MVLPPFVFTAFFIMIYQLASVFAQLHVFRRYSHNHIDPAPSGGNAVKLRLVGCGILSMADQILPHPSKQYSHIVCRKSVEKFVIGMISHPVCLSTFGVHDKYIYIVIAIRCKSNLLAIPATDQNEFMRLMEC